MPSKTPKQAKFMAAVAHGWKPTQKGTKAPPLKVAREFNKADKGTKRLKKGMKMQFGGLAQSGFRGRGRRRGMRGRGQPGGQGMMRPAVQPGGGQLLPQPPQQGAPQRGVGARPPGIPQRPPSGGLAQYGRAGGGIGGAGGRMQDRIPARPSGVYGTPGFNSLGPLRAADSAIRSGGQGVNRLLQGPPYGGRGYRFKKGGKVSRLYEVTVSLRDWVKGKGELHQRDTKEVRAISVAEAKQKVEAEFPELRANTAVERGREIHGTKDEFLSKGGRSTHRRKRKGRTKREDVDKRGRRKKVDTRARRKKSKTSTKRG